MLNFKTFIKGERGDVLTVSGAQVSTNQPERNQNQEASSQAQDEKRFGIVQDTKPLQAMHAMLNASCINNIFQWTRAWLPLKLLDLALPMNRLMT